MRDWGLIGVRSCNITCAPAASANVPPIRLVFPGALYHVMARGNAREAIFADDADREAFLEGLAGACGRFDWALWAYCLMDNHYHVLIETL